LLGVSILNHPAIGDAPHLWKPLFCEWQKNGNVYSFFFGEKQLEHIFARTAVTCRYSKKKWFPAIFTNEDIPPLNGDRIMTALALHRARERSPERFAGVSVLSSSKKNLKMVDDVLKWGAHVFFFRPRCMNMVGMTV